MTRGSDSHVDAWKQAKTLEDLGELTARWCEGSLGHMPDYSPQPDAETEPLRGILAAINRRGLVTTFSQPGVPLDERGYAQRASLEGRARESTARRLGALGLWTELLVLVFPPGDYQYGYQMPITVEEFRPFTWLGAYYGHEELVSYAEDCSREAYRDLLRAWTVKVIDPHWGREPYLWPHVSACLEGRSPEPRFSVEPYDEGLGTDFVL